MVASITKKEGRGRTNTRPMSEINVTPFVDVMLVLLVVFMVTAPLLAVGVPVNLPNTEAPPLTSSEEPLTVVIDSGGQLFLQETEIGLNELVPRLIAIADNGYDEPIYVRADESVDYGTVMVVMGHVKAAGFHKLGLVTDPLLSE